VSPGDVNDASKSAWYNACSAQGNFLFPYDVNTFDDAKCRGNDTAPWPVWQYDQGVKGAAALNTSCLGGTANLFQMSGNVAEWENSCSVAASGPDLCRVRGGSYLAGGVANLLACTADRTMPRLNPGSDKTYFDDVGFRCCTY